MKLMKEFPDKYFDLAIVDPPYGIGASRPSKKNSSILQSNGSLLGVSNKGYELKDWDISTPDDNYFNELFRVSKNQIIWGENFYDIKFPGGRIVWDKLNGESDQMGCEIAYCSLNKRTDIVYFMWAGMMQGMYCGKDARKALIQQGDKSKNEKRIHPTQKPVALYKWLLKTYAKEGDKILDTHLGSGSIAIACHDYGYELTACEIDKQYFNDATKRYQMHTSQTALSI